MNLNGLNYCLCITNNFIVGSPRGVMVKAFDCGIEVNPFELQLFYYIHSQTKTFGKGMNPLILPAMC